MEWVFRLLHITMILTDSEAVFFLHPVRIISFNITDLFLKVIAYLNVYDAFYVIAPDILIKTFLMWKQLLIYELD